LNHVGSLPRRSVVGALVFAAYKARHDPEASTNAQSFTHGTFHFGIDHPIASDAHPCRCRPDDRTVSNALAPAPFCGYRRPGPSDAGGEYVRMLLQRPSTPARQAAPVFVILNQTTLVNRGVGPSKRRKIPPRRSSDRSPAKQAGSAPLQPRRCCGSFGAAGRHGGEPGCPQRGLRPVDRFTIAMQKCNWISGTVRSGRVFLRTPPHSAMVRGHRPAAPRRYCAGSPLKKFAPIRQNERRRIGPPSRGEAESKVRMILQVFCPNAGK